MLSDEDQDQDQLDSRSASPRSYPVSEQILVSIGRSSARNGGSSAAVASGVSSFSGSASTEPTTASENEVAAVQSGAREEEHTRPPPLPRRPVRTVYYPPFNADVENPITNHDQPASRIHLSGLPPPDYNQSFAWRPRDISIESIPRGLQMSGGLRAMNHHQEAIERQKQKVSALMSEMGYVDSISAGWGEDDFESWYPPAFDEDSDQKLDGAHSTHENVGPAMDHAAIRVIAIGLLSSCYTSFQSPAYVSMPASIYLSPSPPPMITSLHMHAHYKYAPASGYHPRETSYAPIWPGLFNGPCLEERRADDISRRRRLARAAQQSSSEESSPFDLDQLIGTPQGNGSSFLAAQPPSYFDGAADDPTSPSTPHSKLRRLTFANSPPKAADNSPPAPRRPSVPRRRSFSNAGTALRHRQEVLRSINRSIHINSPTLSSESPPRTSTRRAFTGRLDDIRRRLRNSPKSEASEVYVPLTPIIHVNEGRSNVSPPAIVAEDFHSRDVGGVHRSNSEPRRRSLVRTVKSERKLGEKPPLSDSIQAGAPPYYGNYPHSPLPQEEDVGMGVGSKFHHRPPLLQIPEGGSPRPRTRRVPSRLSSYFSIPLPSPSPHVSTHLSPPPHHSHRAQLSSSPSPQPYGYPLHSPPTYSDNEKDARSDDSLSSREAFPSGESLLTLQEYLRETVRSPEAKEADWVTMQDYLFETRFDRTPVGWEEREKERERIAEGLREEETVRKEGEMEIGKREEKEMGMGKGKGDFEVDSAVSGSTETAIDEKNSEGQKTDLNPAAAAAEAQGEPPTDPSTTLDIFLKSWPSTPQDSTTTATLPSSSSPTTSKPPSTTDEPPGSTGLDLGIPPGPYHLNHSARERLEAFSTALSTPTHAVRSRRGSRVGGENGNGNGGSRRVSLGSFLGEGGGNSGGGSRKGSLLVGEGGAGEGGRDSRRSSRVKFEGGASGSVDALARHYGGIVGKGGFG
ncbi:hypothetical protein K402DRAFT_419152 [Aulographum hederae CBS 113979]|uniref:Uncharacterized protein n=1 Tax=Aulographum hederae CBS 113979 TaxID=1176131 RepID=A0A6G1H6E7_9PEZI|nr:hypothetical protein K402DRAFT_419152 [Aulographum hederae CBS 113979]